MNKPKLWLGSGLITIGLMLGASVFAQNLGVLQPSSELMRAPAPETLPPLSVDWKAVAQHMQAVPAPQTTYERAIKGFSEQRKDFDSLSLPILLPGPESGINLSSARLVALGDVYDVVVPATPDLTYHFSATKIVMAVEPGFLTRQKRDKVAQIGQAQELSITQSESGFGASFMRFGIVYSVAIDCLEEAPECQNDAAIRALVTSMSEVVLGNRAESEMNKAGFKPTRPDRQQIDYNQPTTNQVNASRLKELERKKANEQPNQPFNRQ